MHDAAGVSRLEGCRDLRGQPDGVGNRKVGSGDPISQRQTGHELHDDEVDALGLAKLVHSADVRVRQARQGMCFARDGQPHGLVARRSRQHLQGDVAVEPLVMGAIDGPHPAGPELLEHAIVRQGGTDHFTPRAPLRR
jgi:hypothetical protein